MADKKTTPKDEPTDVLMPGVIGAAPLAEVDLGAMFTFAEKHQGARLLTLPDGFDKSILLAEIPTGNGQRAIISLKDKVDQFRLRPEHRQGTAKFETLQSFIDHVNRFKTPDTVIFATAGEDKRTPKLTSVIDYHSAGAEGAGNWRKHMGVYPFPLSDEYIAWDAKDGEWMNQSEFAVFLEERILDVSEVPQSLDEKLADIVRTLDGRLSGPTKLMELSRGMQVNVGGVVKGAVNISSGEATIMFIEQHADENGTPLKVPSLFLIAVPIFRNDVAYRIVVRLRYRVSGQRVMWSYSMYQPERAFDHAFSEAATKAQVGTKVPLLFGTAE
jgi:hypothetical protein